jgi:hypothetical protein
MRKRETTSSFNNLRDTPQPYGLHLFARDESSFMPGGQPVGHQKRSTTPCEYYFCNAVLFADGGA